jgi:hypothetical protein
MALAAKAMRPENRAIGMGIFFMGQFLLQGPAPGIAGWIYDNMLNPTFPVAICNIFVSGNRAYYRSFQFAKQTDAY